DGSALTPGNVSSTGGRLLNKPDITAADGVSVTGAGGFPSPFFGTPAAAPHAAAISAPVQRIDPSRAPAPVSGGLATTAIPVEAPGLDRDAGAGMVMAYPAMQSLSSSGTAFLALHQATASEDPGDGNGVINAGEGARLSVFFDNLGVLAATNAVATITTATPGVTLVQPAQTAPASMPAGALSAVSVRFTVASTAPCPLTIDFTAT